MKKTNTKYEEWTAKDLWFYFVKTLHLRVLFHRKAVYDILKMSSSGGLEIDVLVRSGVEHETRQLCFV